VVTPSVEAISLNVQASPSGATCARCSSAPVWTKRSSTPGLCQLRLKSRDLLVAPGDGLLPVGAAHLRLVLRHLLLPEVFLGLRLFLRLVAMVVTCHIGLPFSSAGSASDLLRILTNQG
jgi:hypothetical protein